MRISSANSWLPQHPRQQSSDRNASGVENCAVPPARTLPLPGIIGSSGYAGFDPTSAGHHAAACAHLINLSARERHAVEWDFAEDEIQN